MINTSVYKNKKGEQRLAMYMPLDFAIRVKQRIGDAEADLLQAVSDGLNDPLPNYDETEKR